MPGEIYDTVGLTQLSQLALPKGDFRRDEEPIRESNQCGVIVTAL